MSQKLLQKISQNDFYTKNGFAIKNCLLRKVQTQQIAKSSLHINRMYA